MKTPKLTELERLALRCGVYGGIPTYKLDIARRSAQRKIAKGAKYEPFNLYPK